MFESQPNAHSLPSAISGQEKNMRFVVSTMTEADDTKLSPHVQTFCIWRCPNGCLTCGTGDGLTSL